MAEKKIEMTQAGLEKLEKEYRHLLEIDRPEVIEALKMARSQGDLSENADYDAARGKQAEIEAEIKQIENTLSNCEIIDATKTSNKKVALGSSVTIRNIDFGTESTFTIVGSVESDPVNGKISNACPLGEAIIGKSVGDIIDVKAVKSEELYLMSHQVAHLEDRTYYPNPHYYSFDSLCRIFYIIRNSIHLSYKIKDAPYD